MTRSLAKSWFESRLLFSLAVTLGLVLGSLDVILLGSELSEAQSPVPLNSSVLILDRASLVNAPEYVDRIADLGERRLLLVISMQCRLDKQLKPFSYGILTDRRESWASPHNFEPMTDKLLGDYRELLSKVFRQVESRDLDLAILLHLDPAGEINEWRNLYDFDPRKKIRGYSYEQLLIESSLMAIQSELSSERAISFSIAGEMGKSLARYPESYLQLRENIRSELLGRNLKIGLSLNHNELFADEPLSGSKRLVVQELINQLDFLGISHYRPFVPPSKRTDFDVVIDEFVGQLNRSGLKIPPTVTLHLSEVGIGGAPDKQGNSSPERAASMPWLGTSEPGRNPWNSAEMRESRRDFHRQLLQYLSKPSAAYRLEEAYLWSESSWDPVGVIDPNFSDPVIRAEILNHNQEARPVR